MENDILLDEEEQVDDTFDEGDLELSVSKNIFLEQADRSLAELKRWYDDGDLIIDPEWQRNYVWNSRQASKLIESFLIGIPVPVIYLAKTSDGAYEVIDGLQRLSSIFTFFNNRFRLTGLDMISELNGKDFKSLEKSLQRKLKNSTLRSFELSSETDPDIHFLVFERLNTGGTKLNDMEIRNCLYRGHLNNLIKELSENSDFISTINQSSLSKRMNDRALVLRFLSFYEKTHHKCTKGLKRFLNDFFETYRNPSQAKLDEYRKIFEHCMRCTVTVFGDKAYRLKIGKSKKSKSLGEWATRINAPLFQVISTSFVRYDIGSVTRNADAIYEEYLDLINSDSEFIDCVRRATGESSRLSYVFNEWQSRLESIMKTTIDNDQTRLFSKQLKTELFSQNSSCSICNQEIKLIDDAMIDHHLHHWRGGQTIPENARLTHRYCNLSRPN